ncbi:hypothetical protein AB0M47_02790 [Hamadaea sp. NPDC051192]|uniref:hypothetical protein n=1 Tax=Hamadaea sp. NPDC051192 TaxID=3154940 RepID=UPI00341CDEE4
MQGLLRWISTIDSAAERALRIIEFYDQLTRHDADIEAVTRATAVMAEATAGAEDDLHDVVCAMTPAGRPAQEIGARTISRPVVHGNTEIGRVWLARPEGDTERDWDDLIMERMALAVAAAHARRRHPERSPVSGPADPAIVQYLLGGGISEPDASRSARLLGFRPGQQVKVVVVAGADLSDRMSELRAAFGGFVVLAALSGSTAAVIGSSLPASAALPDGVTGCIGPIVPVERADASWRAAHRGLRFAAMSPTWPALIDTADLGCLLALDGLDRDGIPGLADVRAVASIAAGRRGLEDLDLLDVICASTSLREAATAAHMHHSSINYRANALGEKLGIQLGTAVGRYRARTALIFWRLHCR